jgi:hypothetical protein
MPKGYIDLVQDTECIKVPPPSEYRNSTKSILGGTSSSAYSSRICIQITDVNNTSLILSFLDSTEHEINAWYDTFQDAIAGVKHEISDYEDYKCILFSNPIESSGSNNNNKFLSLEMPRKIGILKKRSIEGKKFGFRNIKTRCVIAISILYIVCIVSLTFIGVDMV